MQDQTFLPSWNLTQYYASFQDPKIDDDLLKAKAKINEFVNNYKTKINSLSPKELLEAIKNEEEISTILFKPSFYLRLLYDAGGLEVDQINQKLIQIEEQVTIISNEITFFEVELTKRPDLENLHQMPELNEYKHYLYRLHQNAKYILSEEVEKVLNLKDLTSSDAWRKLFIDLTSKIEVTSSIEGEPKTYRESDLTELIRHPSREIRAKAWELLNTELKKTADISLEAYNNILLDKKIEDNLRGFTFPQEAGFISNQVTPKLVETLVQSVAKNVNLNHRYLKLKQEILGLPEMELYDVYAQINFPKSKEQKYSWEDAKSIILQSFEEFHPRFAEIAKLFFDNNWIDAADRPRKQGGAYCASLAPGYHPAILCSFKGRFDDVLTVAHELGHGIHSYLTEEKQSLINSAYTLSTAEIASLCCETIVFNKLIPTILDPAVRIKLYCSKLEEEAANIFSAGLAYYNFESAVHDIFRLNGPLSTNEIQKLWKKHRYESIYGAFVNTTNGFGYGWQRIPHFTYIFYNYVYTSGVLISSAIYELLHHNPDKKPKYLEILSLGGTLSPVDLLKKLDLNIEDPEFWDIGFDLYADRLAKLEEEWQKYSTSNNLTKK